MNKVLAAIIAVVAIASGAFVFQSYFRLAQPEFALYYQTPRMVKPFQLIDHNNQAFDNSTLAGKWSWVFFGYTSCPDICPTTLQELNFNYDQLKSVAPNTQVLLVSVDPSRDTTDKLSQYIGYFNAEFKALTADHSQLFPFARNLGLMYAINNGEQSENYLVDHSASLVLINPDGEIAAIFKPTHELGELPIIDGQQVVSDFEKIVRLFG
ncbi:SCO family protein [Thalassotalea fusca]